MNEKKDIVAAKLITENLIEDATKQAAHTRGIVKLIDVALEQLETRLKSNALKFDVSDLDKLVKMRYQILAGQDTDENDVMAIYQRATSKYGLDMEQGVLFKKATPLTGQKSDEEDDLHPEQVPTSPEPSPV